MLCIGSTVWACRAEGLHLPGVGPFPAVVCGVDGALLQLCVTLPVEGPRHIGLVSPWDVEDGTEWGWLEIPADGIVPVGLLE